MAGAEVNPRDEALALLGRSRRSSAFTNILVPRTLDGLKLSGKDSALVTELVYGVTRYRLQLDWLLDQRLSAPGRVPPVIRDVLRMGAYQIVHTRIPVRAAVYEAVRQAKRAQGEAMGGLVNAVLRRLSRDKESLVWPDPSEAPLRSLSIRLSHPEWLVAYLLDRYGPTRAEAIMTADNKRPAVTVRVNRLRASIPDVTQRLAQAGRSVTPGRLSDWALKIAGGPPPKDLIDDGSIYVQDEASMLVGVACRPKPGMLAVDIAAGLGGKTTLLAEMMNNSGQIYAIDKSSSKLRHLRENCARMGIKIVTVHQGHVLHPETFSRPNPVDLVLVDAPCSGLGVLRRRPDARWRVASEDPARLARIQRRMLGEAARLVGAGGRMVYSVCTYTKEETESTVADFLGRFPDWQSIDLSAGPLARFADGRESVQIMPDEHDADGMFIAAFQRTTADS